MVLDFGAQYTQLIARRIRECHAYCEILPFDTPLETIQKRNPVGLVFSGGPSSVYDPGAPQIDRAVYGLGLPILGICYGMQAMAHDLGGKVSAATLKEFGKTQLEVLDPTVLFEGLNPELICWMSHGDTVEAPPPGFRVSAATENCPVAAMYDAGPTLLRRAVPPHVLDFGAQYTQLIARRIRECHVYCEILPYDTPLETIQSAQPRRPGLQRRAVVRL